MNEKLIFDKLLILIGVLNITRNVKIGIPVICLIDHVLLLILPVKKE